MIVRLHHAGGVIERGPYPSVTLGGLNADLLVAGNETIARLRGELGWVTPDGTGIGSIEFFEPPAGSPEMAETAKEIARLLNTTTTSPQAAVTAVGLDPEEVWGEDIGDECLPLDDPDNDVVDLGWHDGTHYQIRRSSRRSPWAVEVMQRHAPKEDQ